METQDGLFCINKEVHNEKNNQLQENYRMIYRTSQEEVGFETKEDFLQIDRIRKQFKVKARGNKDKFKKLLGDYFNSLPLKEKV